MTESTTPLPEVDVPPVAAAAEVPSRRLRLMAIGVVLSVSFAHFLIASAYSLFQADKASQRYHSQIGVFDGLLAELISLALLGFVLSVQGRRWADIGWTPQWSDLVHGLGLIAGSWVAAAIAGAVFQSFFRTWTGHYLQARPGHGIISGGVSVLTILIVIVNPFFEELIVRGYLMTEVIALGGGRNLAIIISVLVQVSYHLYQGLLRCVAVGALFLVFSIYFSRRRKIGPVVLAHFWSDAWALIRLARQFVLRRCLCENSADFQGENTDAEALHYRFNLSVYDYPVSDRASEEAGYQEGVCWPRSR